MHQNTSAALIALAGSAAFGLSLVLPRLVARLESRRRPSAPGVGDVDRSASLDVIIPSYLEAGVIGQKIADLRGDLRDWPGVARIVVVASDDQTADAAREADLVIHASREGKAAACNLGVAKSTADIVVLTDANCRIEPPSWPSRLAKHLQDWSLVSANKTEAGGSEGAFWALERATKASLATGTLSVAGEFLAFRRGDYRPIPKSTVLDDLSIALSFASRGLPVTVAPDLTTTEDAVTGREQWERRVRIAGGLFTEFVPRVPELMTTPNGRIFVAHKLYRVTVGCVGFWVFVTAASFVLPPWSFLVALAAAYLSVSYHIPAVAPPVLAPLVTAVGLQTVAPAALFRQLRQSGPKEGTGLWKKIPR